MSKNMNKLKPCPFCGNKALHTNNIFGEHYVVCTSCTCAGPGAWTEKEAIEAWNMRANDNYKNAKEM